MRKVIKEINVYKYNELKGDARKSVFKRFKENYMDWVIDEFIASTRKMAATFGLTVTDYEFFEDGGHVYFDYDYPYRLADIRGARAYAFIQNNFFSHVDKRRYMGVLKVYSDKDYTHLPDKNWMENCYFAGVDTDVVKNTWDEFVEEVRRGNNPSVLDFILDLSTEYVEAYIKETKAYTDDCAVEEANGNEMEFLEDGSLFVG